MGATLIRLIAEMIEGLQVPRSIGVEMMGAAMEPHDEIRDRLRIMGWVDAGDIEDKLIEKLKEELGVGEAA